MNSQEVKNYEKIKVQIKELYKEISILSKKSPDSPINRFKLKIINKLLIVANELLIGNYMPFDDFDVFNEDDMPTNSDVAVILSQYIECLDKLKLENVIRFSGSYYWVIDKKKSDIITTRPSEIMRR